MVQSASLLAMVIELTEQERAAVIEGKVVHLQSPSLGAVVILRESEYNEAVEDSLEKAAWVAASTKALNHSCEENPF